MPAPTAARCRTSTRRRMTDQYRPTDKWLINAGLRLDSYGFVGQNTLDAAARRIGGSARVLVQCVQSRQLRQQPDGRFRSRIRSPGQHRAPRVRTRPTSRTFRRRPIRSTSSSRASAERTRRIPTTSSASRTGATAEAPNTAFEQYNTRQEDLADYIGSHFLAFGTQHAGLSDSAADLDQLRPLVGAPLQGNGSVVQADAVLAPDAEPDSAVLPRPDPGLRFRSQRRKPAQRRRRVPDAKGRLLARRHLGAALVRLHQLVHPLRTDRGRSLGHDGAGRNQQRRSRNTTPTPNTARTHPSSNTNSMCGGTTSQRDRPTRAIPATELRSAHCRAAAVRATTSQIRTGTRHRKRWWIPAQTFRRSTRSRAHWV